MCGANVRLPSTARATAMPLAPASACSYRLLSRCRSSIDKLLHFHGRETNVIIDAAVALGLILSFHRIQHWVNHQVNHFFFHHWHEAAEKLRAFMGSATHISDANALQQKFIAAIVIVPTRLPC
jgi:hypothetical protein